MKAARQSLQRYSEGIEQHLAGAAEGKEPEAIHQVRVSCRRLRTALQVFGPCLAGQPVRRWRKEVKHLLKSLRKARDADIQIQFLEDLLKQAASKPKVLPGLRRLLLRLRQKRGRLQKRIRKAVERFVKKNILSEIQSQAAQPGDLQNSSETEGIGSIEVWAGAAVGKALEKTTALLQCLQNPKDTKSHHRLRIAVKRLRYTLEIFQPGIEGDLERFIKPLKKLQTLLGDLNDCVVWLEQIETFSSKEKKRTEAYFGHSRPFRRLEAGLDYVRRNRKKQWRVLYEKTCCFCQELEQDGFWRLIAETFLPPNQESPPEYHEPCQS